MQKLTKRLVIILISLLLITGLAAGGYWAYEKYFKPEIDLLDTIESVYDQQPLVTDWYNQYHIIAHAFGSIEGNDYTNSLDAFISNYAKGTRIFEIDLQLSSDDDFVLVHEWDKYCLEQTDLGCTSRVSTEQFKETKIDGKYRSLTLDEVLYMMQKVPNFYVVVDSKTFALADATSFYQKLKEKIDAVDPTLIKHFIPQAYSPEMYTAIKEIMPDNEVILTLYSYYVDSDGYKIYQEVKQRGIKVIVMHMKDDWAKSVIRDIRDYAGYENKYDDLRIYIHTINDYDQMISIVEEDNFFGIYSDDIGESDFNRVFE